MSDKLVMSEEITYDGINMWYVSIFKKLGWMVLAKDKYPRKVIQFKFSIDKWLEKTNNKLKTDMPEYMKQDIKILRQNMMVLDEHVKLIFADIIPMEGGGDESELDEVVTNIYNIDM